MNKKLFIVAILFTLGSQNFVDAKATTTITHLDNTTALIKAVKSSHKSIFKKALKFSDVNFVDKHGKTAMNYAAEMYNKKFILEMSKRHACVTTERNRNIVVTTIQHKIRAYKGAGIFGYLLEQQLLLVVLHFS